AQRLAKMRGDLRRDGVEGLAVDGHEPELEPLRLVLDELVADDAVEQLDGRPDREWVHEAAVPQVHDLADAALDDREQARSAAARAPAGDDPRDVAEPVVEEHRAAVDEVGDDDLARLAVRDWPPVRPDDRERADVLVDVVCRPLLAEEPDPEDLDRAVLREDGNAEALLDQPPALLGHPVRGVHGHTGRVEGLSPGHDGSEQDLEVRAIPADDVGPQAVDRLDHALERLVDADRVVPRPKRPVAGAVVEGAHLLRRRDRLPEAEIQGDIAEPPADEVRLDRPLPLVRERTYALLREERHPQRRRQASGEGRGSGEATCYAVRLAATSYLVTDVRWPGVSPAGIAFRVSSPFR